MLKISNLSKTYNGKQVLKDINFNVENEEFLSIIGPSGAGKSTLLRIISNLEKQTSGEIILGKIYSKENPAIMVFQDFSLFPHMSIEDNISYGLKMRKASLKDKKNKTEEMLRWFDLEEKAKAYPSQLSAGQQQRVAIARALIVNPMLLLLDEPFANLDKNLKMDTALFIKKTQKKFGITTIMVTHDQEEAFFISDRIGLLVNGSLLQIDKPDIVYHEPVNLSAAQFLGQVNTIPSTYLPYFILPSNIKEKISSMDKTNHLSFRYESVSISQNTEGHGEILESHIWGKTILFKVRIQDIIIGIYELRSSLKAGDRVNITLHQIINKAWSGLRPCSAMQPWELK